MRIAFTILILASTIAGASLTATAADHPFRIVERIAGPDGPWDYASVDAARRRLYVSREYGVMAIDLVTGAKTEKLVAGAHVHSVLPLPGGSAVVSSNGATGLLTWFDGDTGAVKAETPAGTSPDGMLIEPKTGLVIVFAGKSHDAHLFTQDSASAGDPIALGGKPEAAAADGTGRVFVNIEDKAEIAVLDAPARRVVGAYALPGCESPSGLARWPARKLLIAACENHLALVLDETSGAVVARLDTCDRPDSAFLDLPRKRGFIPCDGSLAELSLGDDGRVSVAAVIETQRGARTGAVDPETGRVYLPTAKFAPAEGGARRKLIPGTFEVLVLTDAP